MLEKIINTNHEREEICLTTAIDRDNYRRFQETNEALRQVSPIRKIVGGIMAPVSYIIIPAILLGVLGYLGYRKIANRLKNH